MTYLKYKFSCITILLLFALHCSAQTDSTIASNKTSVKRFYTSLSGKITDAKTGIALPGATVFI